MISILSDMLFTASRSEQHLKKMSHAEWAERAASERRMRAKRHDPYRFNKYRDLW